MLFMMLEITMQGLVLRNRTDGSSCNHQHYLQLVAYTDGYCIISHGIGNCRCMVGNQYLQHAERNRFLYLVQGLTKEDIEVRSSIIPTL